MPPPQRNPAAAVARAAGGMLLLAAAAAAAALLRAAQARRRGARRDEPQPPRARERHTAEADAAAAAAGVRRGKRVMILMSATGGGHRASAEALKEAFRLEYGAASAAGRAPGCACGAATRRGAACAACIFFTQRHGGRSFAHSSVQHRRCVVAALFAGDAYDVSIVDLWSQHAPYPTNELPKTCARAARPRAARRARGRALPFFTPPTRVPPLLRHISSLHICAHLRPSSG
jgi:hypothetical protein